MYIYPAFKRNYTTSMYSPARRGAWLFFCLYVFLCAGGCETNHVSEKQAPVVVAATQPVETTLPQYIESTGVTEATEKVDIVPRITGTLQSISYKDGSLVTKDATLFVIDPKPFAANVAKAQADLKAQQAIQQRAMVEYTRNTRLYAQRAASQATVVSWREQLANADAQVEAAKAALESAQISLGYTVIRAPFTGYVSRHTVDIGNTVSPQSGTLATIVAHSPMYATFTIQAQHASSLAQYHANGAPATPVVLAVGDGPFATQGTLDYIAPEVDATSGTLRMRAVFANDDGLLLPGLYVRLRLTTAEAKRSLVIPRSAVIRTQGKSFVYTINKDQQAELTPVQVGYMPDTEHITVVSGLEPTAQVIYKGNARLRQGQKVTTTPR